MSKKIAILLLWAGIVGWPAVGYGGDFASLELEYRRIVASKPGTDEALNAQEKLVRLYVKEKMPAEAEAAYAVMLADFAGNAGLAKAVDHVADKYREIWNYHKALELCRYVVSRWPESEHAAQSQGGVVRLYIKLGDEPNATAAMNELISKFGNRKGIGGVVDEIGDTYRDVGEYERALSLYEQAVASWPDSEEAVESQGSAARMYMRMRDYAAASAAVEKLLGDYSESKGIAKVVDQVADEYRELKKYDKAMELYSWVVANSSDVERAIGSQASLVRLYIKKDEYVKAQAETEKLISRFGSNSATAKAIDNIADGYRKAKKLGRATELYRWVVENQAQTEHAIESQVSAVKAFIAMGDDPNTETEIDRLLSLFGEREGIASAVQGVGDEYFKQERYLKSLELYSKVVDMWPADEDAIEAQIGVVKSHIAVGDDNEAEAGIDRLLVDFANDAKLGEAAERIAAYYSDEGWPNKSSAVSRYFGQWTGGAAAMGAQVGLAMSYIAAGDEPNTIVAIDKLIADYNELASFAESAFDVATQCFYKRNYVQAIRLWKLVFEREHLLGRHRAEIPYLLATCYERLKDYDKAIGYYIEAVTNYPYSKYAYRAPYRLGMLYRRTEDYEQSIYWFGQQSVLYDNEDSSAKALFFRSVIYRITEEYDKAIADLQEYSRIYPEGISAAIVPLGIAQCYHRLGNKSQAIETLQQGLTKYSDTIYAEDYQSELNALQSGGK